MDALFVVFGACLARMSFGHFPNIIWYGCGLSAGVHQSVSRSVSQGKRGRANAMVLLEYLFCSCGRRGGGSVIDSVVRAFFMWLGIEEEDC